MECMSLMAKEKNNVFTIMDHTNNLNEHRAELDVLKGLDLDGNLKRLWTDQAAIAKQIDKLKQGMELSQEYWKGMAKGLKETKMSAKAEGERLQRTNTLHQRGSMERVPSERVPTAATSTTLPAISQRPTSKGNMTAR